MKEATREAYDSTAPFYNRRYGDIQRVKYQIMIDLPVEGTVLDIGCGTGLLYDFLGEAEYVGVDISFEMLRQGRFTRKVLADCEALPFGDAVFDRVFSFTVLQNLPSHAMISEAYRVLKYGGIFVLTVLKKSYSDTILDAVHEFEIIDRRHCGEDLGYILKKVL